MIHSGLVSITFRALPPAAVVDLVVQAGLDAIEWGGDIHVPHGDVAGARRVGAMTIDNGLTVAAYGSYYRVGHPESALGAADTPVPFEAIVETAIELGTPKIRVWAGTQGTDTADHAYFEQVVKDSQRIANLANSAGLVVAYEYHGNTLTDTVDAAKCLLETVNQEMVNPKAVRSYWQPRKLGNLEDDLAGIESVKPWLTDIHVFSWHETTGERLPLQDRADDWKTYLRQINQISGERFALLEFVQDDEPANFLRDAATLKKWLRFTEKL